MTRIGYIMMRWSTRMSIATYNQCEVINIERLHRDTAITCTVNTFALPALVAVGLIRIDPTTHDQYSRTCHFRVSARLSLFPASYDIEVWQRAKTMQLWNLVRLPFGIVNYCRVIAAPPGLYYRFLLYHTLSLLEIMARRLAFALAVTSIFFNADARFATQGSSNVAVYWGEPAMVLSHHI